MFNEIITDLEKTYIAKNKDYGNSFEESLNEFGEIAGLVRIGDKFNRAKNLSENKANVINESKIDTYLDMANYCIMQVMWLMKSKL
ncbi:nucleotide modification associated domain-containing protein [Vagococcus lutrae]|nr:nucleotide modification associated domain-containing protein [Vagococcus lutrae]MDT2808364.1 nucleotide modification associated domain-containing protein [Vagococcus lutrae]